ncbi:MAG: right-handed parallel beta-helix repeat-containing protein [Fibrobacteria bacterium]
MNSRIWLMWIAVCMAGPAGAAEYFVDSKTGADDNTGQSAATAWKSLAPVKSHAFAPGDIVNFMPGSQFTEALTLDDNGTQEAPITFRISGTGEKPLFTGQSIRISGDWNIVDGLMVKGTLREGVAISSTANHNVVRNCEMTECGSGLSVQGSDNLITKNYIHDLKMVTNTQDNKDDDNGATGIWMHNSRIEISYNRFVNCKAPSYDYKFDGGAVEWWAEKTLDSCYIHHNFATGCEGFLEAGGRSSGVVSNSRVEYNVSVNNGWFGLLNSNGQYAVTLQNFVIQNNTVVQTVPHGGWGATRMIFFNNTTPKSLTIRNNIFSLVNWYVCDASTITHENNLFNLRGGGLGFTIGAKEKNGDPLFVDAATGDYRLKAVSPAIDMGAAITTKLDQDGHPVPVGGAPDAGAYEYQGASSILAGEDMRIRAEAAHLVRLQRGRVLYRASNRNRSGASLAMPVSPMFIDAVGKVAPAPSGY